MTDFPEFDGPTIPANRLPPDCPLPVQLTVSLASANAKARRAFIYGSAFGSFVWSLCAVASTVWKALT